MRICITNYLLPRLYHNLAISRFSQVGTNMRPNRRTREARIVCVRHVEAKHRCLVFLVLLVLLARLVIIVKRDTDRPNGVA